MQRTVTVVDIRAIDLFDQDKVWGQRENDDDDDDEEPLWNHGLSQEKTNTERESEREILEDSPPT